jgi:stress-induced-phosphoprotein 1
MSYLDVDTAQGLTLLSNGFMRDDRVFHINQPNWIDMYNQQGESASSLVEIYTDRGTVYLEVTARKAWDSQGLETVKELAQKRLKENGWDDVRPALAVTVRCATTNSVVQDLLIIHCSAWIMRAGLEGGLREQPQAGVEYYRRALDLVEWGRAIWKDVPKSSRGAIFEHSFLIGVRSLYLKMFMNVGREFAIDIISWTRIKTI